MNREVKPNREHGEANCLTSNHNEDCMDLIPSY